MNQWKEMIVFRDYLNTHSELVKKYSTLKNELEEMYSDNRILYTESKAPFIQEVLRLAIK